jgi:SAM-dependent methyltransferase
VNREHFVARLNAAFHVPLHVQGNFVLSTQTSQHAQQQQTNDVFTDKWGRFDDSGDTERLYEFQRKWYLDLYGFRTEAALRDYLADCAVIFDAGCGLGYKAAWFAQLAPHALVIGMDFSDAARRAAQNYAALPNLFFIQGDIASTGLRAGSVDYVSCDQVIMHTQSPEMAFAELARIARAPRGQVACYFYAKKALPRELLDDYFRLHCKQMSREQLWAMSEQLAELGKRLSELNVTFDSPDIPALGIKGGRYDLQRFLYWNFAKCFWNAELGRETSIVTNFDWYSPSNARRFSEAEVRELVAANALDEVFFHSEEACYSGRFARR